MPAIDQGDEGLAANFARRRNTRETILKPNRLNLPASALV
jgi:hypothetical protein